MNESIHSGGHSGGGDVKNFENRSNNVALFHSIMRFMENNIDV